MNLISATCMTCGSPIEVIDTLARFGAVCEDCAAKDSKAKKREVRDAKIEKDWDSVCPKLYRDSVPQLLPYRELSMKALRWPDISNPGRDIVPGSGLNLWGYPRTGKTRTMYLVLKQEHMRGARVKAFGPAEFAHECECRSYHTAQWIRWMSSYDILAFDDVDKCKLSPVQESKFFSLLDARVRNRKPTFFTGNTKGDALITMFRNGDAIVGRIRDHCVSIHFPEQKPLID